ncbi:MAG: capsid protein VP2 [Thermoplasmata archaeon]|nr:capsid protein VP2 [Candidatus Sysuiplasma jiujiangense]
MRHDPYWIQGSIRHPGRVTEYVRREYGDRAFEKGANGREKIKMEYLIKARDLAREHGNRSLEDAVNMAITLRKANEEHQGK